MDLCKCKQLCFVKQESINKVFILLKNDKCTYPTHCTTTEVEASEEQKLYSRHRDSILTCRREQNQIFEESVSFSFHETFVDLVKNSQNFQKRWKFFSDF